MKGGSGVKGMVNVWDRWCLLVLLGERLAGVFNDY